MVNISKPSESALSDQCEEAVRLEAGKDLNIGAPDAKNMTSVQVERAESPFLLGIESPGTEVGKLVYNLQYIDIDRNYWWLFKALAHHICLHQCLKYLRAMPRSKSLRSHFPPF